MLNKFSLYKLTLDNNLCSFSILQLEPLNLEIPYSYLNLFYVKIYIHLYNLQIFELQITVFSPFLLLLLDAYQVDLNLLLFHLFVVICYPTLVVVDAKFHRNPKMFYIVYYSNFYDGYHSQLTDF